MRPEILHYRLERRLGAGGMGEVWLARDTRLERPVALKFLNPGAAAGGGARERLLREARAASRLDHPNVLRVHAVETTPEEGDFLVLEYVDGRTLREVIEAGGLDLASALDLAAQCADGLRAAHERGVVHRDVKPDNALVDGRGRVRVMDFGLSKVSDATRLTVEGSTMGTLAYMSPEQARAEDLDARTDVFSFGMLLFELVTGRLPFRHDTLTPATAIQAILHEPPEPFSRFRPGVPPALQALVNRLLTKDRQRRPADLGEVAAEIRRIRDALAASGGPSAGAPAPSDTLVAPPPPGTTEPGSVTAGVRASAALPRSTVLVVAAALVLAAAVALALRPRAPTGDADGSGPAATSPGDAPAGASAGAGIAPAPSAATSVDPAPPAAPPSRAEGSLRVVRQRPLPVGGRDASDPTLSPDGTQVAFAMEDDAGVKQIWLRSLDEGDPLQLTRQPRDCSYPRWSPKGGLISFNQDEGFLGTPILRLKSVWVMAPPTGTPRRVLANGYSPSWSDDGTRLLFDDFTGVGSVSLDGEVRRRMEGIPDGKFPIPVRRPRWSPDGTRIAFFHNDLGPAGDYWVIGSDGTGLRQLTHRTDMGGGFDWSADGRSLVVSAAWGGATTLWRVPVDGDGAPTPVTSGTGEDTDPAVSADGRRILFVNARHSYALKVLDVETRKERTVATSRMPMTAPQFSPDGETIALSGGEEPGVHLMVVGRDGRGMRAVSRGDGEIHLFPQWSADGASLHYYRKSPDGSFAWERMPAAGGPGKVLRPGWTVHFQVCARVSPDGTRVTYLQNNGMRVLPETVVEPLEASAGARSRLDTVLLYPRWSPDGKRLVGSDLEGRITVVPLEGGAPRFLSPGFTAAWSPDGKWIYWIGDDPDAKGGGEDASKALLRVPAEGEGAPQPERLASVGRMQVVNALFDVSARGEVTWVDFQEGRKEIWVLELE